MAVRPEAISSSHVGPCRRVLAGFVARRPVPATGDGWLDHHLALRKGQRGHLGVRRPGSTHSVGTVGTPARSRSTR